MKRILVTGGRDWADYDIILHALRHADESDDKIDVVIHGGAQGADTLAHQAALQLGLDVIVEFADWGRDGKAAGLIRNQLMIDKHHPTHVFAFPSPNSRGTYDMIRRAEKANIPGSHAATRASQAILCSVQLSQGGPLVLLVLGALLGLASAVVLFIFILNEVSGVFPERD